jgi:ring-1,2-phenylacetyl-CoA epoxidase subunit PaaE
MEPFIYLAVSEIIHETRDAITIKLIPENGQAINYRPGQFITLIFNQNGKEIRRSFSLSSSPGFDSGLFITMKRMVNGEVSTYIYNHIRVGDVIKALPPAGRFVLKTQAGNRRDIFLVAAGSGITPVFSILKDILINETLSRVILIYSNRDERSTIFYEALNILSGKYPSQFKCIYVFSEPEKKTDAIHAHLNFELLRQLIDQNLQNNRSEAEFMLCGPFGFMRMAEMIIIAMGFNEERVHKENFVVLAEQEAINSPPVQELSDKYVTINYHDEIIDLLIPPGKAILKAALEKGIYLPYSCQGGICGTCSAICSEGKVEMTVNEVLTQKELDAGWILTCVGYPMTEKVRLKIE